MSRDWAEDVLRAWRESAPFWAKHERTVRTMFGPITEALLDEARLAEGQRVVDVAGGPGEPSLSVAQRVGSGGCVVHTDVAFDMVTGARHAARDAGLENVLHAVASGQALPLTDASCDRVVCRLGIMFFPDAPAAVAEMLRVLRPGGLVTLAVWGGKDENPFFVAPSTVVGRYVESPPDPPDAPGAWRFAEPGLLADMLEEAGAGDVRTRPLEFRIRAPIAFDEFWATRVELSDTLREKMARLDAETAREVKEDVREATREFFTTGTMDFPASVLVVSGRRGGEGVGE